MVRLKTSKTSEKIAEYIAENEELKSDLVELWARIKQPFGGFEDEEIYDRDRGILSKTDRRYLLDILEYEHIQSETNRRRTIRERIINSLQDHYLLFWCLDPSERRKIVNEFDTDQFETSIASNIAFLYHLVEMNTVEFERLVADGIARSQYLEEDGSIKLANSVADVSVDIDIERGPSPERVEEKFRSGEPLTDTEIGLLVRTGVIDESDFRTIQEEA